MLIGLVAMGGPARARNARVPDLAICAATVSDMERLLTLINLVVEGFFSHKLIGVTICPWSSFQQSCSICQIFQILSFAISIRGLHVSDVIRRQARERKLVE